MLSAVQETEETVSGVSKDSMQIPKAFPAAQITIRKMFQMIDSFACSHFSVTFLFFFICSKTFIKVVPRRWLEYVGMPGTVSFSRCH